MRALVCKILGHRWRPVWANQFLSGTSACYVCLRCRENGWMVR